MTSLRVTPEQLAVLSGAVARTSADVAAAQQSLTSQLSPLFGTEWSGTAAGQFTALYEDFDRHAAGLTAALAGIGQTLSRAGAAYADVESRIATSFR